MKELEKENFEELILLRDLLKKKNTDNNNSGDDDDDGGAREIFDTLVNKQMREDVRITLIEDIDYILQQEKDEEVIKVFEELKIVEEEILEKEVEDEEEF